MHRLLTKDRTPVFLLFACLVSLSFFVSGCGPKYTYPKEKISESVVDICKKEYKLDVEADYSQNTLGAVMYADKLIDETGQIDKSVHEAMGQVAQTLTRVALSTDAHIEFCVLHIRDKNKPLEITITRTVDDARRANADVIGIEESMNRTVFGQGNYATQGAGDSKDEIPKIAFQVQSISRESFLADQITQRIRYDFAKPPTKKNDKQTDDKQAATETMALVDGNFNKTPGARVFRISIIGFGASKEAGEILIGALKIVSKVLDGYKFEAYDQVEIQDYVHRSKMTIPRLAVSEYANKKLTDHDVLERFVTQSRSIKDTFKLFNFKNPQE